MSVLLPAVSALATAACAARARVCKPRTIVRTHMSDGSHYTHDELAGQSCSLLGGCSRSVAALVPCTLLAILVADSNYFMRRQCRLPVV